MEEKRLLAVDGVDFRLIQYRENVDLSTVGTTTRTKFSEIYEKAVWIDVNLNGSCVVDPFFKFHFYDEADAVAFKLRWA